MDKLIFLDTETTGNDLLFDRLVQISYSHSGKLISEFFKAPVPISIKAQSITHITNKMIGDKKPFSQSEKKIELWRTTPSLTSLCLPTKDWLLRNLSVL